MIGFDYSGKFVMEKQDAFYFNYERKEDIFIILCQLHNINQYII